ncbi:MFS general substrate transporter [Bimuria novae-zelandiae CBS 107.79]|uniref:MFS general substrate transporter n=1 Tax=Bimuria novae-zelandiae CBS 107.79 TaxID=1447943 RepID=A0A6A5UT21_9PLEO|nr:MFS general substrate transporter [Bimuria novae-zelandiae CBS 107.79]
MSLAGETKAPSRDSSVYEKRVADRDVERAMVLEEKVVPSETPAPQKSQDDIGSELEKHLSRRSTRKQHLAPEIFPLMDLENNLVGWESQDDPTNPRNFPENRKWFTLTLVSAITFLCPLTSSIFAPAVSFMSADFHNTSQILGAFSVSVFVLGFAVGPLLIGPLSEIYGRRVVLNGSNVIFCAFDLGCALAPNLAGLIIMRFLGGVGGSACLTVGSGVIADLFPAEQRGKAMAVYSTGILFGPVLGPIIGGFIAEQAGWRWVFWVVFIASCCIASGLFILLRETNHAVILDRKTAKLKKEMSRPELQNIMTHQKDAATRSPAMVLKQGIIRPLKLLTRSPIVFCLSVYMAFCFGLLYLLFTTITEVYIVTYDWSPQLCGLAYLGLGIGFFAGLLVVARTSDATIIKLTKKNSNVYEPEYRLAPCLGFGFFIPISFFWYGWCTYYKVHWIVPIIGLIPFGFGSMGVFMPIQTYIVDSFPQYAASAMAGMTCVRMLFGAVLPLAGPSMYRSLGLGWGNSLLGFVAVGMIPVPALVFKYGTMVRKKWPVNV